MSRLRVAHVTACYAAADGVGNTLRDKLEASRVAGDEVRLFVEAGAPPVPPRHRDLAAHVDLADLVDERAGGPSKGFFGHDVHLFQLLHPYPLLRAAALVDTGALAIEVPGFTPAEHYRHEEHFRRLQEDLGPTLSYLDLADRVFVHSQSMARELEALHPGLGERVHVLRLGVDSEGLVGGQRGRRGPRGPGPRLLYVGRFAGNKRVDLLLRAFARLRRDHPEAVLELVGDRTTPPYDRYGQEVDALAHELGVAAGVRCPGRLDAQGLADAYADADVFVTASLHEGFCLPAAEAMVCGVPPVGFGVTALPELLEAGGVVAAKAGDPEALAAAIQEALDGGPQLGERALAAGQDYTQGAFRARYRAQLEELAALGRGHLRPAGRRSLLRALADAPVHYQDRCDWPVVGGLVSALRRRMTLHFEKYYVRKLRRLQALFNALSLDELAALEARVRALEEGQRLAPPDAEVEDPAAPRPDPS